MESLGLKERLALAGRDTVTNISNFHLLHYRQVDGFLVTAKNSGTHWLKYMLSYALASDMGLPPPQYSSGPTANDFVGHPKWPHKYPSAPRIASSHNLPSSLFAFPPFYKALKLPPIVVLLRNPREAMLSHYVKWRSSSGLDLGDYVRVAPPGRKYVADIWWYIDFFNRWGRLAFSHPSSILLVRYEDLQADQRYWLERILTHYRLSLSDASIDAAVCAADRGNMRVRLDPDAGELIIPADGDRHMAKFSAEDEELLQARFSQHLRYAFGYGYGAQGVGEVAVRPEPKRASAA